ncbi:hypothetical protein BOO69_12110 [Sulfitobacter alexandrii]|uniref:Uncharacterized protein n=1 Tax=Sulfitobacter alexandrii TaxID=1917485 RepID=A0A1J0WID8_9RHOB|nr:tetratricopeptide repeat protein [Sulfitobacter alexandrii]APE44067.1 hypothetical protein BOO69_12110 [Sulfitobacter alexandrii]
MRMFTVNLKHHLAALGASVLLSGMVMAETVPPELMERLRTAPEQEAPRIAREVETIWGRSGSAAMDLLLKRGRDAMEEEDYLHAIEHFTALTDHAPEFAEGYHARAEAFFRSGRYGMALADLETALALNPENYEAIFGLGVMIQEFGDPGRAAELYRRVLAIYPHHPHAGEALTRLRRDGIGREL